MLSARFLDGSPARGVVVEMQSGDRLVVRGHLRLLWLIEEVRLRRLGVGKAATLAELARAAFMRLLGEHGVPMIDYDAEDLDRELGLLGPG